MSQNIFADLRGRVLAALQNTYPGLPDEIAARVEVTATRDPAHGDMATNAAMVAAKPAGKKPAEIAAALVAALAEDPMVAEAATAGPGFVNLRLRPKTWRALLPDVLRAGEAYGAGTVGQGVRVNV